jgi:putative transposase
MTLIVAQLNNKLIAPKLLSGSCNAQSFNTWLDEELCPHLDAKSVVIMDNARIHKTEQTQALIQGCGASLLYLPPYSPDYNPVEHQFGNIKRLRSYNADKPIEDIVNMYR